MDIIHSVSKNIFWTAWNNYCGKGCWANTKIAIPCIAKQLEKIVQGEPWEKTLSNCFLPSSLLTLKYKNISQVITHQNLSYTTLKGEKKNHSQNINQHLSASWTNRTRGSKLSKKSRCMKYFHTGRHLAKLRIILLTNYLV